MNITFTSLQQDVAARASVPAGAGKRHWLARAGTAVWRAFEASGQARAQRYLLDFANECESYQPELAKELRAAARHGPLA